jgi:hypothetical protein
MLNFQPKPILKSMQQVKALGGCSGYGMRSVIFIIFIVIVVTEPAEYSATIDRTHSTTCHRDIFVACRVVINERER